MWILSLLDFRLSSVFWNIISLHFKKFPTLDSIKSRIFSYWDRSVQWLVLRICTWPLAVLFCTLFALCLESGLILWFALIGRMQWKWHCVASEPGPESPRSLHCHSLRTLPWGWTTTWTELKVSILAEASPQPAFQLNVTAWMSPGETTVEPPSQYIHINHWSFLF